MSLLIKNILLIEHVEVDFTDGLCVITGETGAGKSILLNSLLFCLGQKTKIQKTSFVRPGQSIGEVCCVFDVSKSQIALELLKENNIEPNEDNTVIIRRLVNAEGKTKILINNIPCTIGFLSSLGEIVFEFHTQSQQSKLANDANHDLFLIQFGGFAQKIKQIGDVYSQIKILEQQINDEISQAEAFKRDYEYNLSALKELKTMAIQPNEELELVEKRSKIKTNEKQFSTLNEVAKKLGGEGFRGLISSSVRLLSITDREDLKNKLDELLNVYDEFEFLLQKNLDGSNFNERDLEKLDDRIHEIRDIARKYRISTSEIDVFIADLELKVSKVQNSDKTLKEYQKQFEALSADYISLAEELSHLRLTNAAKLSIEITKQLKDLGFIDGDFIVDVQTAKDKSNWSLRGFDKVKFLAKTNKGMTHDSISKIASGGEISRFMLAFKTVLNKSKQSGLIVFDEIDQGIGGQTAIAVANKLVELSGKSQVLLITHQAVIASKANLHLKIYKQSNSEITTTGLLVLDKNTRTQEIARMLFGESNSNEAINSARKLLEQY